MKLSTKGRYGARLMLDLALHYNEGLVLLKDIARRQKISEKYLGHLLIPLKAAGLINSNRGAHGGYILAKEPQNITLGEVIRTIEGDLTFVECVGNATLCSMVDSCVTREIWAQAIKRINDVLYSFTLQDMVERQKQKKKLQPLTYSI